MIESLSLVDTTSGYSIICAKLLQMPLQVYLVTRSTKFASGTCLIDKEKSADGPSRRTARRLRYASPVECDSRCCKILSSALTAVCSRRCARTTSSDRSSMIRRLVSGGADEAGGGDRLHEWRRRIGSGFIIICSRKRKRPRRNDGARGCCSSARHDL